MTRSKGVRFVNSDNTVRIDFDPQCIQHFGRSRQTCRWHPECGGMLFARSVGSADGYVNIFDISGPYSNDQAGRFWLELDHKQCILDIKNRFNKSAHFVGYWHTHPQKNPVLSDKDQRSLTQNLRVGGIALSRMIAVVIGNSERDISLSAYLISTSSTEKMEMV